MWREEGAEKEGGRGEWEEDHAPTAEPEYE